MNILIAPLTTFLPVIGLMPGRSGPSGATFFLATATIITIALVVAGIRLVFVGGPGDIEISGLGIEIKTQTGGIALIAIGLIFYLAIGKMVLKQQEE